MQRLADFERIVVLCTDRTYAKEYPRIKKMLLTHDAKEGTIVPFVDGRGALLPYETYDQISPVPPADWRHSTGGYCEVEAVKKILRRASNDAVENLLFIEDDCVFTKDFEEVVDLAVAQWQPWDILYYGANHTWAATQEVSPNVLKLSGSLTTHCIAFNNTMFDVIVNMRTSHIIDKMIADTLHHCYACYAIWPNIALQKPGYSGLSNTIVDYTDLFKNKGVNH